VFQVLTRTQLELVLKMAPRTDGPCINQKAVESLLRRAFMTLGPQKFFQLGHAQAQAQAQAQAAPEPNPGPQDVASTQASSTVEEPPQPHVEAPAALPVAVRGQRGSLNAGESKSEETALDKDDEATTGSRRGSKVPRRDSDVKAKGPLHEDVAWLQSFDNRFENAVKRLEVMRDQSHF
jgi:hypothetical protein